MDEKPVDSFVRLMHAAQEKWVKLLISGSVSGKVASETAIRLLCFIEESTFTG